MKRVGIFGGAFNPPHNGHVALANAVQKELSLDEILIIPTFKPPHKNVPQVPFADRMEMARLAFDRKRFIVSDIERSLAGESYTLNTIRALKKEYEGAVRFYLIIGGDMLFGFRKWFHYESILKESTVIAAARDNDSYIDMVEFANELGRVKVLNLPVIELSSTEIREKISADEDVSELVPAAVLDYIKKKELYK